MVFGIPGTEAIDINFGRILGGIGQVVVIIIVFLVMAGVIYLLFTLKSRKKANKKIFWFEEIHGNMVPIDEDVAKELTIPGSQIKVFYIKKKDMYLPRPVKKMGKDAYWFCIRSNREIVNFAMKNLNKEMKLANLDFDHTDMRYALVNLKELIKRSYRDKSTPWWREYKEVISIVILIFVLSLAFFFIISKTGALIDKAGILIDHADQLIKSAEALRGSGVIQK